MPIPSQDQQTAPTRGDLLAAIAVVAQQVQAVQAITINNQQAIEALSQRLTDAGLEAEANVFGAILTAARTD